MVWNWAYSAFGDNILSSVGAIKFNLHYPGQYYDENGLSKKMPYDSKHCIDLRTKRNNLNQELLGYTSETDSNDTYLIHI